MSKSTVKEIMTEFVQTLPVNSSVLEASQMMTKFGMGYLVVTRGEHQQSVLRKKQQYCPMKNHV